MRIRWLKTLNLVSMFVFAIATAACGPVAPSSDKSTVAIHFPKVNQLASHKVGAMAGFEWNRACFVVNVTASDLNKPQATCDIPVGVFRGAVAPGDSVSLEVPKGYNRKLEIFTYMRASSTDNCPQLSDGFGTLEKSKIVRVGEVSSFDTQVPEVTLEVSLSAPSSGSSIISQYHLPASCDKKRLSAEGSVRITSGHTVQQGGGLKIKGSISGRSNEVMLSSPKFKIRLSRQEL